MEIRPASPPSTTRSSDPPDPVVAVVQLRAAPILAPQVARLALFLAASLASGGCRAGELEIPTSPPAQELVDDRLVAVTAGGLSLLDKPYSRLYGPAALTLDTLSNFVVGGPYGIVPVQRFRAPAGGKLVSLRTYWPDGEGYASGTGGTIRIRVLPDAGPPDHLPDMAATPVATGIYQPRMTAGKHTRSRWNDLVPLSSSTDLVRGQVYHVVYDNLDPSPQRNWISVNYVATLVDNGRPGRWLNAVDWGALEGKLEGRQIAWTDYTTYSYKDLYHAPLVQFNLADGTIFGNSDMESGNSPRKQWVVRHDSPVRERFIPQQDRRFQGLSFAAAASVAGKLRWELKDGEDVLATGTVAEESPSFRTVDTTGVLRWFDVALPTPVQMLARRPYDLVFTPQDQSAWHFFDERNGRDYGFEPPACACESQAQHFMDGKWLDAYHWDHTRSSPGSNWRVVLHLVP